MDNPFEDKAYRKRDRRDVFSMWVCKVGMLALGVLAICAYRLNELWSYILFTQAFVLGGIAVIFRVSQRHRQEHKQLYDMLTELKAQKDNQQP